MSYTCVCHILTSTWACPILKPSANRATRLPPLFLLRSASRSPGLNSFLWFERTPPLLGTRVFLTTCLLNIPKQTLLTRWLSFMSWFLMACSFKRSQRDRLLFCDVQFHFPFGHTWLSIFAWIIFDSRCPFLTHLTCGDLFTHPSNPPNLGGENEPTWFVLVQNWKNSDWLWMELWIWAHWISPPTNQAKDEKENRWFLAATCDFHFHAVMCLIFHAVMFLIFLVWISTDVFRGASRRLGVDGCTSQPSFYALFYVWGRRLVWRPFV